ncbi:GtrA family protein [Raoultella terrigena]|uniref:GtrA family protein n=1 Tax=Raoultella terrigena TaxID=577 RepID=UPI002DBA2228|nr:GtrA family protein [Raoultella terrigena]MEB7601546.1 GtrA family protein [Raoultella terrigena]
MNNLLSNPALKYVMVGLLNTAITAVVIFLLMSAGVGIYISNALGYMLGILFSFVVNSLFTFSTTLTGKRFIKFLASCAVCWVANIITVKIFLMIFSDFIYIAQLCGMIVYTISGYLINKLWVMK